MGRGTCSSIDQGLEDADLLEELTKARVTNAVNACLWARRGELEWLERGVQSRGDVSVGEVLRFREACKANPVPSNGTMAQRLGWAKK